MAGARFVDPKILARIGNLELLARTVVDGFINGLHRAPFFGASIDFAEHRGYVAGDDIRRVDWRLYARTDRYYVKQYEADTNTNFTILFDISKSMSFASAGVTKLEYGCFLGACLAYLAHAPARPRRHHHVRRRHRHPRAAVGQALQPGAAHARPREGRAAGPPERAAEEDGRALQAPRHPAADLGFLRRARRDSRAIKPLRFLGNDLIVFHVLDPQEINFEYDDASSFEDLESREQMPVVPQSFREQYRALIQEHINALTTKFSEQRIDYALLNTSEPLDRALFSYLSSREKLMRVR